RLKREIEIWRKLKHPHVLELLGNVTMLGGQMITVCLWMERGDLVRFLSRYPEYPIPQRLRIVGHERLSFSVVHTQQPPIIHGDISGCNILLDTNCTAYLSDFETTQEIRTEPSTISTTRYSLRWCAPECVHGLNDAAHGYLSKDTDIYSMGSVILQVLSGKIPFYNIRNEGHLLMIRSKRKWPKRPPGLGDHHWELICQCWLDTGNGKARRPDALSLL
ncbi:kinase-like domain-containing protein, partial [Crucibulum laeve]